MGLSELTIKLIIILGSLLGVAFLLGGVIWYCNRRKTERRKRLASLEAAQAPDTRPTSGDRPSSSRRHFAAGEAFGVREIDSEYYGGIASRPSSPRSHSPDGSVSTTLLGSPGSSKTMTAFPMTSEISLHGGVKHSSPLAQNPITADEIGVAVSATRRVSRPMRSILQPSQAEKLGQDAAVDMGPNMQLTPLTAVHFSQPSASTLVGETQSPLSSNFIFSARHGRDDSVPAEPPQLALPDDIKGSIRSIPTQGLNPYVGSHSKSLGERRTTRPPSHPSQKKESSHVMPDTDLSMVPSRIPRGQRSIFGGSFTERPASRGAIEPESVIHRSRGDPVTIPKPPRALSAVGDWGAAIFQQIDQSLEESRPSTARAPIPKPNEQTPPPHSRDLSNASSNYSTTQDSVTEVPTRQPSHRIVVGSPVLHEACSPHPRPTSTVIATDPHFKGSRRDTRTSQHTLSTRAHSILLAELLDTYVQSQNARALAKKKKPETERRKAPTPPQRRDEHKAEPFIIPSEIM